MLFRSHSEMEFGEDNDDNDDNTFSESDRVSYEQRHRRRNKRSLDRVPERKTFFKSTSKNINDDEWKECVDAYLVAKQAREARGEKRKFMGSFLENYGGKFTGCHAEVMKLGRETGSYQEPKKRRRQGFGWDNIQDEEFKAFLSNGIADKDSFNSMSPKDRADLYKLYKK